MKEKPEIQEPTRKKNDITSILILTAIPFLYFFPFVFQGKTFFEDDLASEFFPWYEILRRMLQSGRIHFWDPWTFSGTPMAPDLARGLFYPLNLALACLSVDRHFVFFTVTHCIISGLSMYFYLRHIGFKTKGCFLGAFFYALNAGFIIHIVHPSILPSIALMPLLFLLFEKSLSNILYIFSAIFTLTLMLLSGHPQYPLLALVGLFIIACFRIAPENGWLRTFSYFIIMTITSIMMASIQLIPAIGMAPFTLRTNVRTPDFCQGFPVQPAQILPIFFPELFYNAFPVIATYQNKVSNFYIGSIPFILSILSLFNPKRQMPFILLGVTSFLCSLGKTGILNSLLLIILPFYRLFRGPERFLHLTILAFGILAASGWEFIEAFLAKRIPDIKLRRFIEYLIIAVFCITYIQLGRNYNPPIDPAFTKTPPAFTAIAGDRAIFRIFTHWRLVARYFSWGMIENLSNINGYDPISLGYYQEYVFYAAYGRMMDEEDKKTLIEMGNIQLCENFSSPLFRLLGLKYLIVPGNEYGSARIAVLNGNNPRFFTAGKYLVINDNEKILEELSKPGFALYNNIILEKDPGNVSVSDKTKSQIREEIYEPDFILLNTISDGGSILFFSEIYYPEWKAYIDGKETEILKADYVFRAIYLPKGNHKIEMKYIPASLYSGFYISAATFLLLIATFIVFVKKNKNHAINSSSSSKEP